MTSAFSLISFLWGLGILTHATVAVRLYALDLHRKYPYFFAFLLYQTTRSLVLISFDIRSSAYVQIYFYTVPVLWIFYVLVVLELYSLVLQHYQGINSLGRWTLYAALGISVVISLLTLIPMWAKEQYRILFWVTTVERGILSSLVLFLFLMLLFLSRYPLKLTRNIIVHCVVYTIFFLGIAMIVLVRNVVGHEAMRTLNTFVLCLSLVCDTVWICFLTRQGEALEVRTHHSNPEAERRLVEQLNSLNATLLRAARK